MQFISIANFSEETNKIINQAIYFSKEAECKEVNLVHIFIAILDKSDIGKEILNKTGMSFDSVYESYLTLAKENLYGTSYNDIFVPEDFTEDILKIISLTTVICGMHGRSVDTEMLLKALLDNVSVELEAFFDYIGISVERLQDIIESKFNIPEEIAVFAEDLNISVTENKKYISNVEKYTDELIEILSRKLKANPCLVGEAGVGKTTIIYDLAQRIVSGKVPKDLLNKHIVYINSSLLTAGTRYRGDFEERMAVLLEWASNSDVILFLDEIHNFISLNSHSDGSNTAGNMIKKYLSDGTIKIIGATTPKEYHSSIENDKAFSRRLQKVNIAEPSIKETKEMIMHTIYAYEQFHGIEITEDAIDSAINLSTRYIKNKFLPDKAYTILDQTAAKAKLHKHKSINSDDVTKVISKVTGVNVDKITAGESNQLINLENIIHKELIGQDNAVSTVCKAIRRAKAGVNEPNRPLASFLFVGPTGVGKTELCKVLSRELTFGKMPLIKVDMSEYSEKYSTSKMIGSAPGYVGYGDGGQLTEKIKNNPYSLLLFDEIEKAHPDVFNIFLQMLDEGRLTDGEGETADLTNCIIVMTSNAGYGADGLQKGRLGFGEDTRKNDSKEQEKIALEALESTFKPEFLNRIDSVVIFDKLNKEQCHDITKLMLSKLSDRLAVKNIKVKFTDSIINHISDAGYSDKYGARNLKREIQYTVEDELSEHIIAGRIKSGDTASISWKNNGLVINIKESKDAK